MLVLLDRQYFNVHKYIKLSNTIVLMLCVLFFSKYSETCRPEKLSFISCNFKTINEQIHNSMMD